MSRRPHAPTDKTRAEVSALCSFGITQDEIATYLDIDIKTLCKHYRKELDTGAIKANAAMAKRLFDAGIKDGSVPAMIFWLKTRARWRETDNLVSETDDKKERKSYSITLAVKDASEDGA
jgi:hypothetical protein